MRPLARELPVPAKVRPDSAPVRAGLALLGGMVAGWVLLVLFPSLLSHKRTTDQVET